MKVRFLYLLAATFMLAATAGVLISCTDNDDNPVNNPTEVNDDDDDPEEPGDWDGVIPVNGLASFMAHFIERDSLGNFMGYVYGKPLDEADPSVLSIGVESLEEADEIFRNIINDTVNYVSMGTGNITYSPVDEEGNKQGEIYLTPGGEGCIARITFSDNIVNEELSEVRFIDSKLWPENIGSAFRVGRLYTPRCLKMFGGALNIYYWRPEEGADYENTFLCLEENNHGKPALLIYVSKAQYSYDSKKKTSATVSPPWYGVWYTKTKGKGEVVRECMAAKGGSDVYVSPSMSGLERASDILHERWDYFVSIYGNDRLNNDIVWSNDWYSKDKVTFKLYGYRFKDNKKGHWRTYTNLGHWCHVVESSHPVDNENEYSRYYTYEMDYIGYRL